ncbi:TetR/AcrR family transcriptional regulator [Nocardioides sp. Kera G14]|uniref:TetR/AcrR family transcriptional regulator n=1 Tax=Nocardioides sp. Kera G14 TaxID=2884264 RepID=UPI001D11F8EB|nr:TetR/AcrR family transcriptional regulator [Nocardioides sp. Kera G14]UDY25416.1 TetR/AcrR family transcriptional regulator [Nocardioides sp. Kera G14]
MQRRNRRLDRPRERVLEVAWELLVEKGLADLTLAELGRRVDTSASHLLYYFGSKDELLLEVLRWSETQLWTRWQRILAEESDPVERIRRFCALYLPPRAKDPRWLLWMEIWPRVLRLEVLREAHAGLDERWRVSLAGLLVDAGVADAGPLARRICALLDGLSVALTLDEAGLTIKEACDHAMALLPSETRALD